MKPNLKNPKLSKAKLRHRKTAVRDQSARTPLISPLQASASGAGATGRHPVRGAAGDKAEPSKAVIREIEAKLQALLASKSASAELLVGVPKTPGLRLKSQLLFRFCGLLSL